MIGDRDNRTICAVSTPAGLGGISVIRISGSDCLPIVRRLCAFLPDNPDSHRVYYGILKDPLSERPLDEVLVTWFAAGRSFTGEPTAEISCHGNPIICKDIIDRLIENGALPADRGEFTYRAFMNDRIDLVQAESVLALIESRSSSAARLALRQLQGDLSNRIDDLEQNLTWCLAHIEAGIDFSTEGLDVVDPSVLRNRLRSLETDLRELVDSFRSGRLLKDGLRIALIGRPNVGKSSLLNNLLQEDRAIVTEIPGTTRDVVEGETLFDGKRFVFLDTAGLREAGDRVEKIGIERSRKAMGEADLVVFVIDGTEGLTADDRSLASEIEAKRAILLVNKMDLVPEEGRRAVVESLGNGKIFHNSGSLSDEMVFFASALDRKAREQLLGSLARRFDIEKAELSAVLSSARHYERLSMALVNVTAAGQGLEDGVGAEFVALELKEALIAIQETLGKRFDDQIMDRVFKEFCIGK